MAIKIDGVTYRTERQWEKRHRHVRKQSRHKGVYREWGSPVGGKASAVFYTEAQTRPWSKRELAAAARERKQAREQKRLDDAREAGYHAGYQRGYDTGYAEAEDDSKWRLLRLARVAVRAADGKTIVIDTETTGLCAGPDEILQLAITDADGNELWNGFYKPTRKEAWPEAQRVNGISPADVAGCPPISEDVEAIQAVIDGAGSICIYNADFDRRFLRAAGISLEGHQVFDTMVDFAELYGDWSDYWESYTWQKLTTAAWHAGYEGAGDAHDALEDCRMTAHVQRWCDEQRLAAALSV